MKATESSTAAENTTPETEDWEPSPPKTARPRKWRLFAVFALTGFTFGSWYRIIFLRKNPSDTFEVFELTEKEPVSSTASIFTIKPKKSLLQSDEYAKAWAAGIWNVQFKQPQLQIVRAYTPLPPIKDEEDDESTLRFLIRKDAKGGEMSSYLHRLPVGAGIELRGPHIEYALPEQVKNVVFVAGGTGIAPALQVAHAMFDGLSEREKNQKTLHIIWGNRRREDCAGAKNDGQLPEAKSVQAGSASWGWALFGPKAEQQPSKTDAETQGDQAEQRNTMVQYIDALKSVHNSRIKVSYFVDEEQTWITSATLENAISALPTEKDAESQVIVSGPPGFITYIAGPKLWHDGEEQQGVLGGRLAQVLKKDDRQNIKVWKV